MSLVVLGHRGMGPTSTLPHITSDITPENSLAAFYEALELGADGIEFDVHRTKDGRLAVIHDDLLNKKVAGANREGKDLGLVSNFNLQALGLLDIGNGHRIPSLESVLDLIVSYNPEYKRRTGRDITINIELKGENTANDTYEVISKYIASGKLKKDAFLFNSFHWERLEELKGLDPEIKVMPAIKTTDLFGKENVQMPGYIVAKDATYSPQALEKLADLHKRIGCHAFDCIVFDLRPELIDFCERQGVGLFTSTSYQRVNAAEAAGPLNLMMEASDRLPFAGFRADNVKDTNEVLMELQIERLKQKAESPGARISQRKAPAYNAAMA